MASSTMQHSARPCARCRRLPARLRNCGRRPPLTPRPARPVPLSPRLPKSLIGWRRGIGWRREPPSWSMKSRNSAPAISTKVRRAGSSRGGICHPMRRGAPQCVMTATPKRWGLPGFALLSPIFPTIPSPRSARSSTGSASRITPLSIISIARCSISAAGRRMCAILSGTTDSTVATMTGWCNSSPSAWHGALHCGANAPMRGSALPGPTP